MCAIFLSLNLLSGVYESGYVLLFLTLLFI